VLVVWLVCAALAGGCVTGWACCRWCRTRLAEIEAALEIERQARLVERRVWEAFAQYVRTALERWRAQLDGEATDIDLLLWEMTWETEDEL
jgi:hypothetical protein